MKEDKSSNCSNVVNIFEDIFSENKDITKYFDKNMVIECSSTLFKCGGIKDFVETYKKIKKALPNFKKIIQYSCLKDEKVFVLYRCSGTHTGESLCGMSPTNKNAEWYSTSIYTMNQGLITKIITVFNELDLCKQLGWDVGKIC